MKEKKQLSDTPCFWQISLPEPLILNPNIPDSEFVAALISAQTEQEISSLIYDSIQKPCRVFLVHCSEVELVKTFKLKYKNTNLFLDKDGDIYNIQVKNCKNQIIGQGEIIPLHTFIKIEHVKSVLKDNLVNFVEIFEEGAAHMDKLLGEAKMVKTQIAMTKPFLA